MTPSTPATATAASTHPRARQDPFHRAVDALTDAVTPATPTRSPVDFADLAAAVLTAVAANAGGIDALLARRPGSWEAALVAQLVEGTAGTDPEQLWAHRTAPIVVTLHVAELVEARYGYPGLAAALERVDDHYDRLATTDPAVYDGDAYDRELAAVKEAWRAAYRAYGDAFTRAVHARAAQIPTLTAPVSVRVVDDPDIPWWRPRDLSAQNPHEDSDPLVFALWDHAADTVPLPVDAHGHLTHPYTPATTGGDLA